MTVVGPTLETARLLLRPPIQADFDGFAEMCQEAETMKFLGGIAPPDVAWRAMATVAGSWSLLGFAMFSVIEKSTGQWIGRLGPWRPGGTRGAWPGHEIGWGLLARAQGRGYATEGATAAMDWAFDTLGWNDVIHCIAPGNVASIAVASRLGSYLQRKDVLLPPPNVDVRVDIYGQTAAEWRARRRAVQP
jgi:RimJ/RimL family protein N-acetyltransferase